MKKSDAWACQPPAFLELTGAQDAIDRAMLEAAGATIQ